MTEQLYRIERRTRAPGSNEVQLWSIDDEPFCLVPVEPVPGTPDREWLKRMADAEDKCESVAAGCVSDEPDLIDKTLPKTDPYDTWADTVDDLLSDLVRRVEVLEAATEPTLDVKGMISDLKSFVEELERKSGVL